MQKPRLKALRHFVYSSHASTWTTFLSGFPKLKYCKNALSFKGGYLKNPHPTLVKRKTKTLRLPYARLLFHLNSRVNCSISLLHLLMSIKLLISTIYAFFIAHIHVCVYILPQARLLLLFDLNLGVKIRGIRRLFLSALHFSRSRVPRFFSGQE